MYELEEPLNWQLPPPDYDAKLTNQILLNQFGNNTKIYGKNEEQ